MTPASAIGTSEIIERIRLHAKALRALGVTALYIHGSRSRREQHPDSDLDVFVDVDWEKFGFTQMFEVEHMLTRELGITVDLGTRNGLHPSLRTAIEQSAVRVL